MTHNQDSIAIRTLQHRNARLEERVEELRSWMEAIVNETDEYDDHDGKTGHISYATIVLTKRLLAKAQGVTQ